MPVPPESSDYQPDDPDGSDRAPNEPVDRSSGAANHDLAGAVGPGLGGEGPRAASSRPPRRRGGPGAFGQLVGIAVSGAMGLVIGYYLLNWLGGPQYNFLHIPLPGLPQPQQHVVARPPAAPDRAEGPPAGPQAPAPAADVDTTPPTLTIPDSPPPGERLPPDYVGPRDFVVRHLEELNNALLAAKELLVCDRCRSTGYLLADGASDGKNARRIPCDVCGGATGGPMTAEKYATLCELAEMVTFAESEPNESANIRRKEALRGLMLRAANDEQRLATIGGEAAALLADSDQASVGIVIGGTVQEVERQGRLHVAKILLADSNELVTVVGRVGFPARTGDRLIVLGAIVRQPAEQLIGFDQSLPVAIWSGATTKLP